MKLLINFLKGMIIGIANIIPGVSGGTMAFILGVYDRLTEAIGGFISNKTKRVEYIKFLSVIVIGAVVGILLFAKLLTWLLSMPVSTQITYFFIIGLIIGSMPFIFRLHSDMKPSFKRILFLVIGLTLVIFTTMIGGAEEATKTAEIKYTFFGFINITEFDFAHNIWLTICGFLSAAAMVLPGISGSALLVSLGEYGNILYIVNNMLVVPGIFFGLGIIPGIILCAKVISLLLKKYTAETYYFIIGLMLASIYQIAIEIKGELSVLPLVILASILSLAAGFCVSYFTSKLGKK